MFDQKCESVLIFLYTSLGAWICWVPAHLLVLKVEDCWVRGSASPLKHFIWYFSYMRPPRLMASCSFKCIKGFLHSLQMCPRSARVV